MKIVAKNYESKSASWVAYRSHGRWGNFYRVKLKGGSGPHIGLHTQPSLMEESQNSFLGSRERVRGLIGRISL